MTAQSVAKKKVSKSKSKDVSSLKSDGSPSLEKYNPYIKEIRKAFWKVLVSFSLGAILGMTYYQQILSVFMSFFQLEGINLVLTSPYQFINLSINTGFFVGVIFSMPIFLYYFLQFIKPALKPQEFRLLTQMLPMAIVLFIVGFGFGVWVLQYVIDLFSKTSSGFDISNIWDLSSFLSQIIVMGLSLSFIFQMPIIITALLRLKIVSHQVIRGKRRVIYAGLLLFAALLPPTDLVALAILTLIPLFLFEITLLLNQHLA